LYVRRYKEQDWSPGGSTEWTVLVHAQRGIVGRGQALRAGFSPNQIAWRLAAGRWQRVHEGVYATFTGKLSREAQLWAAVRRLGPGALLSYETAAELHGLTDRQASAPIHVTIPRARRPAQRIRLPGVTVHRSDRSKPQFANSWKLPRTRVEDTVLDLIEAAPTFDAGYAWLARALSRDLTTVAALRAALAARSRFRWRAWLADALEEASDGAHSALELRYIRDVERAHGLPAAQRQARRQLAGRTHYKDNWYGDYRVVVEIDGPAYHAGDRAQHDRHRDNLNLAVDAANTYRFGPAAVTERACESAALVAATLRRNGWQGTPRPCRRPDCTIQAKVANTIPAGIG
jgi:hypothetical protein